ncbi:hypothetical protein BDV97DRAFT_402875 [Delphinella strobiligena]|nr:hypothetical protein BDV97DRAFT_402875 [Delphinella strobiligena]
MAAILSGGFVRIDARLANGPGGLRRRIDRRLPNINPRPPNIIPRRPTLSPWAPNFDPRAPNLNAIPLNIGLRLATIDTEVPIRHIDTTNAPNLDIFFLIIAFVVPWAAFFGLPIYIFYVLCTDGVWAAIEVVRTISGATASIVVAGLVAVALWNLFREPLEELLSIWYGHSREGLGALLTLWRRYMTAALLRLRRSVVRDIENPRPARNGPRPLDGLPSASSSGSSSGSSDDFHSLPSSPGHPRYT